MINQESDDLFEEQPPQKRQRVEVQNARSTGIDRVVGARQEIPVRKLPIARKILDYPDSSDEDEDDVDSSSTYERNESADEESGSDDDGRGLVYERGSANREFGLADGQRRSAGGYRELVHGENTPANESNGLRHVRIGTPRPYLVENGDISRRNVGTSDSDDSSDIETLRNKVLQDSSVSTSEPDPSTPAPRFVLFTG